MFCKNCGKELSDTARFCTGCGAQITPEAEQTPSAPEQVQQTAYDAASQAQQTAYDAASQAQQTAYDYSAQAQQTAYDYSAQAQPAAPVKKKKSKKGLAIGAACGGAALVGAGALTFVFAKSAVLHTFMGDEAYAKSVTATYFDNAVTTGKTYADVIAKNADQITSAYKTANNTKNEMASNMYSDAMAAESSDDVSVSSDDSDNKLVSNDTEKDIAKVVYKALETAKKQMPDGYTVSTGFNVEIGKETYALIEDNSSTAQYKTVIDDAVEFINALSFVASQGFSDTDYDVALSVNKDNSSLAGTVLKLSKNGEVVVAFPDASEKVLTAKIPSYEEAGVETGEDGEAETYELDYEKLGKLYDKIKEAYFSRYDKAEIEYTDGSVEVGEYSENCTVIKVTYDNEDIAEVFYSIADAISNEEYLEELCEQYDIPYSYIDNVVDSINSAAESLEKSDSKTSFTTESYVNSMNKPLGIKFILNDKSDGVTHSASLSCIGNDLNKRMTLVYDKATLLDITCVKENAENGTIKISVDTAATRPSADPQKVSLRIDFSGVKKFTSFGKDMYSGKFTLSLDNSPYLQENLSSQKIGDQTLYEVLRGIKIIAATEPSGEGFRTSLDVSSDKYGKLGFYMTAEPKPTIAQIPANANRIDITDIQNSKSALTDIAYDMLNSLFGKLEEDKTFSKLNADVESVSGMNLLDELGKEMKKLENEKLLGEHYSDYTSSSVYYVSDESRNLYYATDTSKFTNNGLFKLRLWYDKDGKFSILDACGEDESVLKEMYSDAGFKSTYAEILVWKKRMGDYNTSPIGVTAVKTDSSTVTAQLPDEYNYIDSVYNWDDYNVKDGYVIGAYPSLYEGEVSSRDGDKKIAESVANYDAAAEKVYTAFTGYLSDTGNAMEKSGSQYIVFEIDASGKYSLSYSSNGSSERWVNDMFSNDILGTSNSIIDKLNALGTTGDASRYATVYFRNGSIAGVLFSDSSWSYYYISDNDFQRGFPGDIEWSYIDGFYSGSVYGTYPKLGSKPAEGTVSFAGDTGSTLTVCVASSTAKEVLDKYIQDLVSQAGVTLKNDFIEYSYYSDYTDELSTRLSNGSDVDIFVLSPEYLDGYINNALTADELGIYSSDLSDQYYYTHQLGQNSSGDIAAFTWMDTAGVFMYRTDIAQEVLGTSDPAEVQQAIATWDMFTDTAAKMKAAGYYMYAGPEDTYRMFAQHAYGDLVNTSYDTVNDVLKDWAEMSKSHFDNGYHKNVGQWYDGWSAEFGSNGKTFGFFFPYWGSYTISYYGMDKTWNVCQGPAGFYWGGDYLLVSKNSDNKALAAEIIKHLTCDKETMKNIAKSTNDMVNNSAAMSELSDDPSFVSSLQSIFGGYNIIPTMIGAASSLELGKITDDYPDIYSYFTAYITGYINGDTDYTTAVEEFFKDYENR